MTDIRGNLRRKRVSEHKQSYLNNKHVSLAYTFNSRPSGWPMPPAAPRRATFLSGCAALANDRLACCKVCLELRSSAFMLSVMKVNNERRNRQTTSDCARWPLWLLSDAGCALLLSCGSESSENAVHSEEHRGVGLWCLVPLRTA